MSTDATLTVVVPCFNSAEYLHRALDPLLPAAAAGDLEVLVVDDGSTDATGEIAEGYAARHPAVRVVRQENAGHGGAIATGVKLARGRYLKVLDSDDRLAPDALAALLATLRGFAAAGDAVDLVVSNYVYEKQGRRRCRTVRYGSVLPRGRVFGWGETGRFRATQNLLMHALTYRTALLRECGLDLPRHTFYVDNLYAFVPLTEVRRVYYLDVDLYGYFIGRADQSVNERVMIGRIDQQILVTRLMLEHLGTVRTRPDLPPELLRYLLHYATTVSAVTSVLLLRAGTPEAVRRKEAFWEELRHDDPWLHAQIRRRSVLGLLATQGGRPVRDVSLLAYRAAHRVVGFN